MLKSFEVFSSGVLLFADHWLVGLVALQDDRADELVVEQSQLFKYESEKGASFEEVLLTLQVASPVEVALPVVEHKAKQLSETDQDR